MLVEHSFPRRSGPHVRAATDAELEEPVAEPPRELASDFELLREMAPNG